MLVQLWPLVSSCSEAAQAIGAINTLILKQDNLLHGDNTEWLAVDAPFACLYACHCTDSAATIPCSMHNEYWLFHTQCF